MINRSVNLLQDRPFQNITQLNRELEARKTRQLNGGDDIVVETFETATTISFPSVGAGGASVQQVSLPATATDANPFYMEFGYLVYVNNDNDATYLWPSGSNLGGSYTPRGPLYIHWRRDQVLSDATTNGRVILFYFRYGAQFPLPAATFYLHTKLYTPKKPFA